MSQGVLVSIVGLLVALTWFAKPVRDRHPDDAQLSVQGYIDGIARSEPHPG